MDAKLKESIKFCIENFNSKEATERICDFIDGEIEGQKRLNDLQNERTLKVKNLYK